MSYIGNPIVSQAFLTDQFSGTGSATSFILTVAPANSASILVAVSGVLQDPTTYGVEGTTLTFSAAPPSGTANISVRYLGIPSTGVTSTAYRTITEITATASQTTFTPASYTVGFLNVYQNGGLLGSADYTASNGTSVVLATGATVGDLLLFESFNVSSVLNAIPATTGAVSPSYLAAAGASKAFLDVVNSDGTGGMIVPTGTTAQRPSSPVAGTFRYNTTTNQTEVYSGIAWVALSSQTYSIDYLVVAGGGAAPNMSVNTNGCGGGAGAGGVLSGTTTFSGGTVYGITIGAGGAASAGSGAGANGSNSVISTIATAVGGGGGGTNNVASADGLAGGSGGGAGGTGGTAGVGGTGTSGQGYAGGYSISGTPYTAGGGGGAGGAGGNASTYSGAGGIGISSSITGTAIYYAGGGGGGGGGQATSGASGGNGGGGAGGNNVAAGTSGTVNTGGGGGAGGCAQSVTGSGGSGVVILSVPTVNYSGVTTGSPTVTTYGARTIIKFTSSGSYTA